MTSPNDELQQVVNDNIADPETLFRALLAREDLIVENLLFAAAQQGLMPSITRVLIVQSGLGTRPDEQTWGLLTQQAHAEMERLAQMFREMGGDTG